MLLPDTKTLVWLYWGQPLLNLTRKLPSATLSATWLAWVLRVGIYQVWISNCHILGGGGRSAIWSAWALRV